MIFHKAGITHQVYFFCNSFTFYRAYNDWGIFKSHPILFFLVLLLLAFLQATRNSCILYIYDAQKYLTMTSGMVQDQT